MKRGEIDGKNAETRTFSILKRIVMGETFALIVRARRLVDAFNILKRIVMGETPPDFRSSGRQIPFSILKRIVMGETPPDFRSSGRQIPFSILKRIVMGETRIAATARRRERLLSVSSSGS